MAPPQLRLVAIQVGEPRRYGSRRTGYVKLPVRGPVWLGRTNLEGDGQANLAVHGGPDKAVLAYAASHYPAWRAELGMPDLPFGAFGENFTVAELDETRVCIGDVYAIGYARVAVSQPRAPCGNISRRWQLADLTQRVAATGRTGWYLRVLAEGYVEAGQVLELLERPHPEWSVARATAVRSRRRADPGAAAALAEVPALSAAWRRELSGARA